MTYLTKSAAQELMRQSAFAGIAGEDFVDIVPGGCSTYSIAFSPGHRKGVPISRESGVTLYADHEDVEGFKGIRIDYRESLAGGGFVLSGNSIDVCGCGNCFSYKSRA